jgi:hypothetical protein
MLHLVGAYAPAARRVVKEFGSSDFVLARTDGPGDHLSEVESKRPAHSQ